MFFVKGRPGLPSAVLTAMGFGMAIQSFQRAVITGASSGIGAALAQCYARRGTNLLLTGRNRDRLLAIKQTCEGFGVAVTADPVDVRDAVAMREWLLARDDEAPIELVIANAGVSGGTSGVAADNRMERDAQIYAVNILGIRNTVDPLVERLRERRRGQIGLVSSMAGFRGLPSAPAYAASKAWVKSYGEGMRGRLRSDGVGVSVICPGFVDSRITEANKFYMPMKIDADRAAQLIHSRLAKNRALIAFPLPMYLLVRGYAALPNWLIEPVLTRLPRKE